MVHEKTDWQNQQLQVYKNYTCEPYVALQLTASLHYYWIFLIIIRFIDVFMKETPIYVEVRGQVQGFILCFYNVDQGN